MRYYRSTMQKKAIYPGTFDPITYGHMDIIQRAARLFSQVVVAVAADTAKNCVFSLAERLALARDELRDVDNVEVVSFTGLLVNFAQQQAAQVVIRGLRAVTDFEYELQLANMNRHLSADIETLFMTPIEKYGYLSSSLVREVSRLGGDVEAFVPAKVAAALRVIYKNYEH